MAKTTSLFPPSVEPARDGVYQVLINGREKYSRWGNRQWHLALYDYESAKRTLTRSTDCYQKKFGGWRGLAKETS